MKFAILSLGLLAASGVARGDEEKVALKDVPKAVLSALKEKFPEGKPTSAVKEEEDGKTVFEVVLEDDDETTEVSVSPKGKIIEAETEIAAKKLPKAVAAAIKAAHPKAKIEKAEKVVKYGKKKEKTSYEVSLAVKGEESVEVKLSAKGKILVGEDVAEEDDDDDDDDAKTGKGKKDKDDDDDVKEKGKKKDNG